MTKNVNQIKEKVNWDDIISPIDSLEVTLKTLNVVSLVRPETKVNMVYNSRVVDHTEGDIIKTEKLLQFILDIKKHGKEYLNSWLCNKDKLTSIYFTFGN